MITPPTKNDAFVHITDLHFWRIVKNPLMLCNKRLLGNLNLMAHRSHVFDLSRAEPFADAVAEAGVRTVLITGDFTTTSTEEEMKMGATFTRGLTRRGLQPLVLPGNHDVYTFESARARRFERHFEEWSTEDRLPGLQRLPGGTPLLLAPTVCPNVITSRGLIRDEEVAAVAAELDSLSSPIVVAGHYPLLNATETYRAGWNRRLRNGKALRRALGESGKQILYVSGHVHRFSYTCDDRYPTLTHLTTGPFFRRDRLAGTAGEFSLVRIEGETISIERHAYRDGWIVAEETLP